MGISHAQAGWLWPAFMMVYMIAAPVFGAWGDRGSRTRPIAHRRLHLEPRDRTVGSRAQLPPAVRLARTGRYRRGRLCRDRAGAACGLLSGERPRARLRGAQHGAPGRCRARLRVSAASSVITSAGVRRFSCAERRGCCWRRRCCACRIRRAGCQDAPGVATPRPARALPAGIAAAVEVYLSLLRRTPYMLLVLGFAAYTFGLGGLGFWMPTFLEQVRGVPADAGHDRLRSHRHRHGVRRHARRGLARRLLPAALAPGLPVVLGVTTLAAAPVALLALTAPVPRVYYPAIVSRGAAAVHVDRARSTPPSPTSFPRSSAPRRWRSAFSPFICSVTCHRRR